MLYHLLITSAILLGLIGLWVLVQAMIRRQRSTSEPQAPLDPDVLACSICANGGPCMCGLRPVEHGEDTRDV
jgi:hypothetical protein